MTSTKIPARVLSVFSLVMINVIAVDSLRTLPFSAKFGSSLIFYYCFCGIFYLIPLAFITAELATTWPKVGGIYVWVKEAFGDRAGFLVVWLQWIYNVVWYPTVLGLVAQVLAYTFWPQFLGNKIYTSYIIITLFWVATFANCFGMKISSLVSTLGSILGTLLPMFIIIVLAANWLFAGNGNAAPITLENVLPKVNEVGDLSLVTTILFGLMGLEMSAVHAEEVKKPETDYPKALKISVVLILFSLMLASYAVAVVVSPDKLNIVTGMLQAFEIFGHKLAMPYFLPIITVVIVFGIIGAVATWIIGPTKGLLAAARQGNLPIWMSKLNKHAAPVNVLMIQAVIVTILALLYTFSASIEKAYLILTELAAILSLIMYALLFLTAFILRLTKPDTIRPYKIPYGLFGIGLASFSGVAICIAAIILSFIPPSQVEILNPRSYQLLLAVGVIIFCLPALLIKCKKDVAKEDGLK